jgi:hypothetical protein
MAITILMPEFIFSKAICDLRLALNDLRELDEYLEEDKVSLQWITSSDAHASLKIEHTWSWQVDYGPRAGFLYRILGLQPPPIRSRPVKKTAERDHNIPTAKSTFNMEDCRSIRYVAEENLEPAYREIGSARGSQECARQEDNVTDNISEQSNNPTSIELDILPSESGPKVRLGEEITQVAQAGSPEDTPDRKQELTGDQQLDEVRRYHTTQLWTPTHAYLANMGGLIYFDKLNYTDIPNPSVVPGVKLSHRYIWNGDHPLRGLILAKEDIEDRSKADWLLKGLTVSQITWLILTILIRGIKDLPLTQLELATLAFSIFAIVTYAANWWKPKDVARPVLLSHMTTTGFTRKDTYNPNQEFTVRLRAPAKARKKASRLDREQRVRNDVVWMQEGVPLIFSIMAVSALVFGGLHCLAWNFQFPSRAELILWRVCSVISMILPVISLAFSLYLNYLTTTYGDNVLANFLLEKLKPLNTLPAEFWERFTKPAFLSWSRVEQSILFSTPVRSRDFDKKPLEENCSQWEQDDTSWNYISIVEDVKQYHGHLCELYSRWQRLKQGERGIEILRFFTSLYHPNHHSWSYIEKIIDFWDDYGDYLRKKVMPPNIPPLRRGCASYFLTRGDLFVHEWHRIEKQRYAYNRVSTLFIIGTGIVYLAARLIILVLLFTSLRAVPAGVYENTPWTRFLPSFS